MPNYPADASARARQLVAEGKIGGARYGRMGGRPRKPRAGELAAAEAAEHAEEIVERTPRPALVLAPNRDANVVAEADGNPAERSRDERPELHGGVEPRNVGGMRDLALLCVDLARGADADGHEVLVRPRVV